MIDIFGTGVKLHLPPAHLFKLPPDDPPTLPPPTEYGTLRSPFAIDATFYNAALATSVPITFAAGYFSFVAIMNQINRRRQYKPWALSKTAAFNTFALFHNVLLALFSAVTFAAMVRMVWVSFPGWTGEHGFVGAIDALCKIQGPRGYGDAVMYNSTTRTWSSKNSIIHLSPDGVYPDATDVGRLWNEGLAFWGWFFYLSKFYEVLDTCIILAKVLGYKVPQRLKRVITTLQILQLITGVFYASIHLFISYDVPVLLRYKIAAVLSNPSAATSVASELIASATQVAKSNGDLPPWAKRLAYRAVGAEGLAESVHDGHIYTDRHAAEARYGNESEAHKHEQDRWGYEKRYEEIPCIDTNGQVFAIWLNVAYLAPLTLLFMRFFVKSYLRKGQTPSTVKEKEAGRGGFNEARRWSESAQEAARLTSEAVESFGVSAEEAIDDATVEIEKSGEAASRKFEEVTHAAKNSDVTGEIKKTGKVASERIQAATDSVKNSEVTGQIKKSGKVAGEKVQEATESIKNSDVTSQIKKSSKVASGKVQQATDDIKNSEAVKDAKERVNESDVVSNAQEAVTESVNGVKDSKIPKKAAKKARQGVSEAKESDVAGSINSAKDTAVQKTQAAASEAKEGVSDDLSESRMEDSFVRVKNEADDAVNTRDAGGAVRGQDGEASTLASTQIQPLTSQTTTSGSSSSSTTTTTQNSSVTEQSSSTHASSYAEAVKEDLAEGDHGDNPGSHDGSMGFGLNG